ncbi:hypothetical protein K2X85_02015 [bacterium]|jgi:hypothetical protein|nr:hypothetical protein [bacterium]
MIRYCCDRCQREIVASEARFVIRISVQAGDESATLTEEDMDEDNLHLISETLKSLESQDAECVEASRPVFLRFDLCGECRARFLQEPLGASSADQLDFSEN